MRNQVQTFRRTIGKSTTRRRPRACMFHSFTTLPPEIRYFRPAVSARLACHILRNLSTVPAPEMPGTLPWGLTQDHPSGCSHSLACGEGRNQARTQTSIQRHRESKLKPEHVAFVIRIHIEVKGSDVKRKQDCNVNHPAHPALHAVPCQSPDRVVEPGGA